MFSVPVDEFNSKADKFNINWDFNISHGNHIAHSLRPKIKTDRPSNELICQFIEKWRKAIKEEIYNYCLVTSSKVIISVFDWRKMMQECYRFQNECVYESCVWNIYGSSCPEINSAPCVPFQWLFSTFFISNFGQFILLWNGLDRSIIPM